MDEKYKEAIWGPMTAIINDAAPGDWIMGLLSGLQSLSFDRESSTNGHALAYGAHCWLLFQLIRDI